VTRPRARTYYRAVAANVELAVLVCPSCGLKATVRPGSRTLHLKHFCGGPWLLNMVHGPLSPLSPIL
jgi:hypothetical protein